MTGLSTTSIVNDDRSIKIPEEIIKKAGLNPGVEVIWVYDEEAAQITLMEKPKDFVQALKGLGKELWENTNDYVKKERDSWE